jgi:hypothetical protein
MRQQLDTALRLTLAGQVRNRFAWILLVAFIPLWYLLSASMYSHTGVTFMLRATHTTLVVDGHNIGLISTGLNSICLLTGFVVFTAVRRSLPLDRRLVLSGYRPAALIAAKTSAALAQAVAIGAYAAIVLLFFWRAPGMWAIAVTFMLGAATYAALGLLLGVLVRGDLEGFFLIIMISLMDTFLQDPMYNPLANKPLLEFFPSYGPTQFAAAAAFHHQILISMAALSLAWTAAFALLGLAVLRLRMPRLARMSAPARPWPIAAADDSGASGRPADQGGEPLAERHRMEPLDLGGYAP